MTEAKRDFKTLMEAVHDGSEDAAEELVERFGNPILCIVRQRLSRRLRSKFDSVDFVQAVWASFFAMPSAKRQFDRPDALLALLTEMARNKVVDAVRQRLQTLKYQVQREQSLDDSRLGSAADVAAATPTPSAVAIAREEWQNLLRRQPHQYQRILNLLREGMTREAVAEEVGVSEKTIRRVLSKVAAEQRDEPR